MKASISEIVGRAEDASGKEVSVYRALRPLLCAHCGTAIKVYELFTRRKLGNISISPRCRECSPFGQLNQTGARSPLIEFLLEDGQAQGKAAESSGAADRALMAKEVEKRLGPVLARCRKRRS